MDGSVTFGNGDLNISEQLMTAINGVRTLRQVQRNQVASWLSGLTNIAAADRAGNKDDSSII